MVTGHWGVGVLGEWGKKKEKPQHPNPPMPQHLSFAVECGYTPKDVAAELFKLYDRVIGALVTMQNHPDQWIIQRG